MSNKPQLFLSHSSKDSEIVNAFVDFMLKIGLNEKEIFCSSSPYTKVAIKTNIYEHLNTLLSNDSVYVLYFLSDNYYSSPVCLNEMGATWLKKSDSLSILLPGFNFADIQGAVDKNKVGIKLGTDDMMTKASLNEFKNDLISKFGIEISDTKWEVSRDEFLKVSMSNSRIMNMNFSNSYCIGDLDNDGCRIIRRESNKNQILVKIDFNKTESKLCSLVVFVENEDFSWHIYNKRNLCFEAYANEIIDTFEVEFHLDGIDMRYDIRLTDDEKAFKIPLEQFCDVAKVWKKVSQISFLIRKRNVNGPRSVVIKNLRIE